MKPDIEELVANIRTYAKEGFSHEDIAELTGKKYLRIAYLANRYNIKINHKPSISSGTLRRPEIDELLTGEYSLKQIGEKVPPIINKKSGKEGKLSRERIRQYLNDTGQIELFRKKRDTYKPQKYVRKDLYNSLVNLLTEHLHKRAKEEDWAVQKAVEYNSKRTHRAKDIRPETLVLLFEIYRSAIDSSSTTPHTSNDTIGNIIYPIGRRREIETKIINLVNFLYPDIRHEKPYLQKNSQIYLFFSLILFFLYLPFCTCL